MHSFLRLEAIAVAALLSGCSFLQLTGGSSGPGTLTTGNSALPSPTPTPEVFPIASFFPLHAGDAWTWRTQVATSDSAPLRTRGTFKRTVQDVTPGTEPATASVFEIEDTEDASYHGEGLRYYALRDDGLYRLEFKEDTGDFMVPRPLVVGDRAGNPGKAYTTGGSESTESVTVRKEAACDVPAGRFADCLKISKQSLFQASGGGNDVTGEAATTSTALWLARGVGMVRFQQDRLQTYRGASELTREVWELSTYSVRVDP